MLLVRVIGFRTASDYRYPMVQLKKTLGSRRSATLQ